MQKLLEHFHQDHMTMQRMVRRFNFEADLLRDCSKSEEHTSELQSRSDLVCRLLLEKKKQGNPHSSKEITT